MRVALNALSITNRSGTGRYVWGLIQGFIQQNIPNLDLRVIIPADFIIPASWWNHSAIQFYSIPLRNSFHRNFWEQTGLPKLLQKIQPEILHSPAFIAPVLKKTAIRHVVTVHDLVFLRYPQSLPFIRRTYYRWIIPRSIANAHTIIADSESIAAEISSSPYRHNRVVPILLGVDTDRFRPQPEATDGRVLQNYDINSPYFLFVGTLEPRKNLTTLLNAFAEVRKAGCNIPLVLVGRMGWMQNPEILAQPGIIRLGFVPDEHLPTLYRHASALTAASLYEGFDLPCWEAAACGTPILASDISAHREILGESTEFINTLDVNAWKNALLQFSQNPQKSVKPSVRDWSETARETYEVYCR